MVSELAENYRGCVKEGEVLILVVVEDGLRELQGLRKKRRSGS